MMQKIPCSNNVIRLYKTELISIKLNYSYNSVGVLLRVTIKFPAAIPIKSIYTAIMQHQGEDLP